ncbi:flagellin N-terminal helical domain-containing protein [Mobiluncus mulieris]|uniref:flagellin N-terminal helical domain-containing protein n=1 Tax=Mobiluncus mulieris TaxID=2052 RepID=UPI000E034C3B|nr:flagellin [Mobiluncus mulieris]STY83444.1 B-type flagellin [Mobiluncus mulieris]
MVVLPGSGSGWVSILGMLRPLIHPTGMCKMPGQGVLVGLAKSLEKLSSGFRINRAADDAAGLAISEGLRSQVGGNRQAVRNAQDGISVIQTAEGALNEVHSILQRMRVLAVQGANDSNDSKSRNNIKAELVQLRDELERIGKVTNFNGTKLLDGTASGSKAMKFQVGAMGTENDRIIVDFKDADVTSISSFSTPAGAAVSNINRVSTDALTNKKYVLDFGGKAVTLDFSAAAPADDKALRNKLAAALKDANVSGYVEGGDAKAVSSVITLDAKDNSQVGKEWKLTIDGEVLTYNTVSGKSTPEAVAQELNQQISENNALKGKYEFTYDQDKKTFTVEAKDDAVNKQVNVKLESTAIKTGTTTLGTILDDKVGIASGGEFKFTVKDKKISFERVDGKPINIDLAHAFSSVPADPTAAAGEIEKLEAFSKEDPTTALTPDKFYMDGKLGSTLSVIDHESAQKLIDVLDTKINSVSTARANLGAIQNRFEHTITNLNVAVENLAASESRIRDTDMAQEMMQFTRNQILSQAGTSMLAQANQVPQGVLSLLR